MTVDELKGRRVVLMEIRNVLQGAIKWTDREIERIDAMLRAEASKDQLSFLPEGRNPYVDQSKE